MIKYQVVRVSDVHPARHAASPGIREHDKHRCAAFCGTHLTSRSLINLVDMVTCERCIKYIRKRLPGLE